MQKIFHYSRATPDDEPKVAESLLSEENVRWLAARRLESPRPHQIIYFFEEV